MVELTVDPGELSIWLALGVPSQRCCNCGRTEVPLAHAVVPLHHERLVQELRAGVLALHCADCAPTAERVQPRPAALLGAFPLTFFLSAIVLSGVNALAGGKSSGGSMVFIVLGATILGLVAPYALFRKLRKLPVGPQTSAYAAIRVKNVAVTLMGKVKSITLVFTNDEVGRDAANAISTLRSGIAAQAEATKQRSKAP